MGTCGRIIIISICPQHNIIPSYYTRPGGIYGRINIHNYFYNLRQIFRSSCFSVQFGIILKNIVIHLFNHGHPLLSGPIQFCKGFTKPLLKLFRIQYQYKILGIKWGNVVNQLPNLSTRSIKPSTQKLQVVAA